jgi:outer membrane lipoprotein-sorting protein
MRQAYQSANSATLESKTKTKIEGKEEVFEVRMDYGKPNLLRMVFAFRGQEIMKISDGKKIYTVVGTGKAHEEKLTLDGLGGDAPINLESMGFFDWKRQLSTSPGANMSESKFKIVLSEEWNGRNWIVLEETAHGQNVFVRYFVDPKTYFIWKCEVKSLDKKKEIMTTEVQKLLLNPNLDRKVFEAPKSDG